VSLVRAELHALDAWRKRAGFTLIGASLKAAKAHDAPDVRGRTMILLGNEQAGLPAQAEALCDALVRIPMRGRADSLNLAVAASVMLYDVWRRRGYAGA
jgi:TrmH family RNA methyltransferase